MPVDSLLGTQRAMRSSSWFVVSRTGCGASPNQVAMLRSRVAASMGLLYVRCSVGIYCKGAPVAFMPRLYEERGLRDVLGRSCHASLSMCAEARKLDGCHHDAGEDEAAPKKAMALRTSPTRKKSGFKVSQ